MNATEVVLFLVISAGPCLAVTLYLGYVLLFRLQIHVVELMVTLLASTLPLGAILSSMSSNGQHYNSEDWAKALAVGSFPMVLIFAGSIWGMSAIKRLEIARSWPRIGALVAGWGLVVAMLMAVPAFIYVIKISDKMYLRRMLSPEDLLVIPLIGSVCLGLPGLVLERRCRRHQRELERLGKLRVREQLRADREARQKKNA